MALEKTPESPLDSKEIKSVNLKGDQPWILVGRTDAEAEAPVFCLSDMNSQLIGQVPVAGKDRGQKEKRVSEDEKAGWHHWCNGHELGQTSRDGEGQGGLACCSQWGHKELDMTGWLNNNNNKPYPAGNELTFSDSYFPLADSFHLWLKSNLPNSQPIKSRPVVFYFSLSSWSSEHASDLLSTEEGDSTYLKLESLYCSFFVCVCSRNMFLLSLINIKF